MTVASETLDGLWAAYQASRSTMDRNALATAYVPWLTEIASRQVVKLPIGSGWTIDDLVNSAAIGLLDAIERFNPALGNRFKTFAAPRVRGAMIDGIRAMPWFHECRRNPPRMSQFPEPKPGHDVEGHQGQFTDLLVDERELPAAAGEDTEDFWREVVKGLTLRERLILLLYFREELTLKQTGAHVGVGESRTSQVLSSVTERIRRLRRIAATA